MRILKLYHWGWLMPDSLLDNLTKDALINLVKQNQLDIAEIKKSYANKANLVEQASQPTLSVNQEYLFWRDTDSDMLHLLARANGEDYVLTKGWDDVRVPLSSIKRLGFSDPDWVQFRADGVGSTGVYALAFDKNTDEEVFFSVQIPHDWEFGTDLHPHIHWSPSDTDTGSVTWKLEYTIAAINDTFDVTSLLDVTDAGDGVSRKHQYADLGNIDMSAYTAATDVSIMLMCRLYRDVSDGDDYDADAFLLEVDFHYQIDSVGSRLETSK